MLMMMMIMCSKPPKSDSNQRRRLADSGTYKQERKKKLLMMRGNYIRQQTLSTLGSQSKHSQVRQKELRREKRNRSGNGGDYIHKNTPSDCVGQQLCTWLPPTTRRRHRREAVTINNNKTLQTNALTPSKADRDDSTTSNCLQTAIKALSSRLGGTVYCSFRHLRDVFLSQGLPLETTINLLVQSIRAFSSTSQRTPANSAKQVLSSTTGTML